MRTNKNSSKEIKYSNKSLTGRRKKKQKTIFQPRNINKFIIFDILFYTYDGRKTISFERIRKFLINMQKRVKTEYASYNWEISRNNDDQNKIKKLESLIARYSIVIYYLVTKNKIEQARKIFLLMIKENMSYIDYHSNKLFKMFNKKYEILKVYPKRTKELFNIYSYIIKYSVFFNLTKIKNMFLIRYLALLSLSYKVFRIKIEMRQFSLETRNQIKYWFASSLHYASYFTLNAYCSPKIPISISGLILKLYRNVDENLTTKQEKSLLIKTSFNQGFLYYINNQCEQALKALKITKQKIMSFYDNEFNNVNKVLQIVDNSNINSTITLNNNNIRQKNSLVINNYTGLNSKEYQFNKRLRNYSFNSSNDFVEQVFINEGNRKKYLKMEDISKIFFLNNNENYKLTNDSDENILNNTKSGPLLAVRPSQTEFDKFIKMKEFNIPLYLKQPLFLNIELLMTEIEIDRKNYILSYEHIKNCIILILIIRQLGDSSKNNSNKFQRELCLLFEYLEEIKKSNKDKLLSSQIKAVQNLNLKLSNYKDDPKSKKSTKSIRDKFFPQHEKKIDYDPEKLKIEKENEKFFIFLNSLSIYQIKLLNETQPINDTRNDLPIFFHNQFKDTLSITQRVNLAKLNIMSLSRCAILNDPNDYILPSNLKFSSVKEKINEIKEKLKSNKKINNDNSIHISFNGSLMNNEINLSTDDKKNKIKKYFNDGDLESVDFGEDSFKYKNTKEFENFKKIIFSPYINYELQLYLLNNFHYAISILEKTEDNEIKDMIDFPEIIIEPIKMYKKKNKNKIQYINENKEEILNQLMKYPEFAYIINIEKQIKRNKIKNQSNSSGSMLSISLENEI
jgi:hypothetical protein